MIVWCFIYFKMYLLCCIFISVFLGLGDGFMVKGPSGPLVVPLGGSVLLPCSVDSLSSLTDLEVQWKISDSQTLIHLYQDGDIRPEVQHEDVFGRAHFFTDDIKYGNFSLLLKMVRAEDEGQYTCTVHSGQESNTTVVEIQHVERLIVSGSDQSLSVYVGEDVTLNCSVDSHIPPEHIEEVSWKKRVNDEHIIVLLYESNKTLLDASDEQYRDRVEFFSDEIHRGNFSLRLKRVRTEDKGLYMCQVFAGRFSDNTTVILEQLGFSSLHIIVLILCISACGFALVICSRIYCISNNTGTRGTLWKLQVYLVVCPNLCVFFAFLLWGFIEGFVNETVTCCALYILRTVMLFWAVRFLKYLQGRHKTWIRFFNVPRELAVFTIIVYSVFFAHGWKISAHDASIENQLLTGMYYGFVVLLSLFNMKAVTQKVYPIIWPLLMTSVVQQLQIIFSFGRLHLAIVCVNCVHHLLANCVLLFRKMQKKFKVLQRSWLLFTMMLLDIPLSIYFHLVTLEREKDYRGWISVILFIQALKMIVFFECSFHAKCSRMQRHQDNAEQLRGSLGTTEITLPLCSVVVYMFGAVGLVLLNSAALMTELILKARNGERLMKDLRVIVFPSEGIFVLFLLVLQMHAFWKVNKTDNASQRYGQDLENAEAHEMETLSGPDTGVL
ncbi:uncharacterized protein LOC130426025 [Triplophysa dalaica]|uniref:uncharacterized protein LOC130426025 n=1 Tax=Triplophysa dalaica TaxID=1582913 RepID=UPI0024DFEB29|nr:uncharacterized protein LOC130426025 [Triplophysa dalaica]